MRSWLALRFSSYTLAFLGDRLLTAIGLILCGFVGLGMGGFAACITCSRVACLNLRGFVSLMTKLIFSLRVDIKSLSYVDPSIIQKMLFKYV